ncbi:MAG: hypothetical protein ACXVGO_10230 [Mycobacterium sp.]
MIRQLMATLFVALAGLSTASPVGADPMSDLIGSLPPGYAPESCHGTTKPVPDMLAGLTCIGVPGTVPGGKYEVFPTVDALRHQFDIDFHGTYFKAMTCPGAPNIRPGTITARSGWRGQLACGYMGHYTDPNVGPVGADAFGVMWTNESRSFWGRVDGTNLADLMDWFGQVIVSS